MSFSKRFFCIFLVLVLLLALSEKSSYAQSMTDLYIAADVNPVGLSVSARSAVLIDAADGRILFSKNAYERLPMASTTKIMTAIVAIECGKLENTYTIPKKAVGVEGSSIYLFEGEKQKLIDLIYALMLESANDAAAAIAIIVGGSIEGFAKMMNDKASELGLRDTNFENPHGLDSSNHFTTAHDLALLTAYALKNETFRKIVSTKKTTIPLNDTEGRRLLVNHNKLLRYYSGAIGVKTGFTRKSGRCLVSAAERDGLTLVAVTLNAPSDWSDHTKMLDYGFAAYERISLAPQNSLRITMPVTGGDAEWVLLSNTDEVAVTLPKSHSNITSVIEAPRFEFAPVEIGDNIGKIVYYCDGKVIGESTLCAITDAKIKDTRSFFDKIISFFGGG